MPADGAAKDPMRRQLHIPPELRAAARAVSDVDPTQFPELYTTPGQPGPPTRRLRQVTTELRDGAPLSTREFEQFRTALAECRQHPRHVPASAIAARTSTSTVLAQTLRLDHLCESLGASLVLFFPLVLELHNFLVEVVVSGRAAATARGPIHDRLMRFLSENILNRAEAALHACHRHALQSRADELLQRERRALESGRPPAAAAPGSAVRASRTASMVRGGSRSSLGLFGGEESLGGSLFGSEYAGSDYGGAAAAAEDEEEEDAVARAAREEEEYRRETQEDLARLARRYGYTTAAVTSGSLPLPLARELAEINADLRLHMAHVKWYTQVMIGTDTVAFNADHHLDDLSMQKVWSTYIGRAHAACTAEEFQAAALQMFPQWSWAPIMEVLNYKNCGVVSLYTVQRLLKVWGPLLLLDRNLRDDMRSGVFSLRQPCEYHEMLLAREPGAAAGDFVAALTEVPGEVRVVVLQPDPAAAASAGRRRTTGAGATTAAPSSTRLTSLSASRRAGSTWAGAPVVAARRTSLRPGENPGSVSDTAAAAAAAAAGGGGGGEGEPAPVVTNCLLVTQETGAWTVQSLTREEFESVAEACRAFADIFRRPRGERYDDGSARAGVSAGGGAAGGSAAPTAPAPAPSAAAAGGAGAGWLVDSADDGTAATAYSALHRACFRNNERYVRTLLARGGGTTVNSAVVDPAVSATFCWTPLLCAVNNPNADPAAVARMLLDAGADPHFRDEADCTCLYYAIANGYAGATRVLLEHAPTLITSPRSLPLLVALGAHHFHLREVDIRRLSDVLPSRAVLEAVTPHVASYALMTIAVEVLQAKLNGSDRPVAYKDMKLISSLAPEAGPGALELRTPEEKLGVDRLVAFHTRLCRRFRFETNDALRVLRQRCYALSWRQWLCELRDQNSTLALSAAAAAAQGGHPQQQQQRQRQQRQQQQQRGGRSDSASVGSSYGREEGSGQWQQQQQRSLSAEGSDSYNNNNNNNNINNNNAKSHLNNASNRTGGVTYSRDLITTPGHASVPSTATTGAAGAGANGNTIGTPPTTIAHGGAREAPYAPETQTSPYYTVRHLPKPPQDGDDLTRATYHLSYGGSKSASGSGGGATSAHARSHGSKGAVRGGGGGGTRHTLPHLCGPRLARARAGSRLGDTAGRGLPGANTAPAAAPVMPSAVAMSLMEASVNSEDSTGSLAVAEAAAAATHRRRGNIPSPLRAFEPSARDSRRVSASAYASQNFSRLQADTPVFTPSGSPRYSPRQSPRAAALSLAASSGAGGTTVEGRATPNYRGGGGGAAQRGSGRRRHHRKKRGKGGGEGGDDSPHLSPRRRLVGAGNGGSGSSSSGSSGGGTDSSFSSDADTDAGTEEEGDLDYRYRSSSSRSSGGKDPNTGVDEGEEGSAASPIVVVAPTNTPQHSAVRRGRSGGGVATAATTTTTFVPAASAFSSAGGATTPHHPPSLVAAMFPHLRYGRAIVPDGVNNPYAIEYVI